MSGFGKSWNRNKRKNRNNRPNRNTSNCRWLINPPWLGTPSSQVDDYIPPAPDPPIISNQSQEYIQPPPLIPSNAYNNIDYSDDNIFYQTLNSVYSDYPPPPILEPQQYNAPYHPKPQQQQYISYPVPIKYQTNQLPNVNTQGNNTSNTSGKHTTKSQRDIPADVQSDRLPNNRKQANSSYNSSQPWTHNKKINLSQHPSPPPPPVLTPQVTPSSLQSQHKSPKPSQEQQRVLRSSLRNKDKLSKGTDKPDIQSQKSIQPLSAPQTATKTPDKLPNKLDRNTILKLVNSTTKYEPAMQKLLREQRSQLTQNLRNKYNEKQNTTQSTTGNETDELIPADEIIPNFTVDLIEELKFLTDVIDNENVSISDELKADIKEDKSNDEQLILIDEWTDTKKDNNNENETNGDENNYDMGPIELPSNIDELQLPTDVSSFFNFTELNKDTDLDETVVDTFNTVQIVKENVGTCENLENATISPIKKDFPTPHDNEAVLSSDTSILSKATSNQLENKRNEKAANQDCARAVISLPEKDSAKSDSNDELNSAILEKTSNKDDGLFFAKKNSENSNNLNSNASLKQSLDNFRQTLRSEILNTAPHVPKRNAGNKFYNKGSSSSNNISGTTTTPNDNKQSDDHNNELPESNTAINKDKCNSIKIINQAIINENSKSTDEIDHVLPENTNQPDSLTSKINDENVKKNHVNLSPSHYNLESFEIKLEQVDLINDINCVDSTQNCDANNLIPQKIEQDSSESTEMELKNDEILLNDTEQLQKNREVIKNELLSEREIAPNYKFETNNESVIQKSPNIEKNLLTVNNNEMETLETGESNDNSVILDKSENQIKNDISKVENIKTESSCDENLEKIQENIINNEIIDQLKVKKELHTEVEIEDEELHLQDTNVINEKLIINNKEINEMLPDCKSSNLLQTDPINKITNTQILNDISSQINVEDRTEIKINEPNEEIISDKVSEQEIIPSKKVNKQGKVNKRKTPKHKMVKRRRISKGSENNKTKTTRKISVIKDGPENEKSNKNNSTSEIASTQREKTPIIDNEFIGATNNDIINRKWRSPGEKKIIETSFNDNEYLYVNSNMLTQSHGHLQTSVEVSSVRNRQIQQLPEDIHAVLLKMYEIDVSIQKLMEEKMKLYNKLQIISNVNNSFLKSSNLVSNSDENDALSRSLPILEQNKINDDIAVNYENVQEHPTDIASKVNDDILISAETNSLKEPQSTTENDTNSTNKGNLHELETTKTIPEEIISLPLIENEMTKSTSEQTPNDSSKEEASATKITVPMEKMTQKSQLETEEDKRKEKLTQALSDVINKETTAMEIKVLMEETIRKPESDAEDKINDKLTQTLSDPTVTEIIVPMEKTTRKSEPDTEDEDKIKPNTKKLKSASFKKASKDKNQSSDVQTKITNKIDLFTSTKINSNQQKDNTKNKDHSANAQIKTTNKNDLFASNKTNFGSLSFNKKSKNYLKQKETITDDMKETIVDTKNEDKRRCKRKLIIADDSSDAESVISQGSATKKLKKASQPVFIESSDTESVISHVSANLKTKKLNQKIDNETCVTSTELKKSTPKSSRGRNSKSNTPKPIKNKSEISKSKEQLNESDNKVNLYKFVKPCSITLTPIDVDGYITMTNTGKQMSTTTTNDENSHSEFEDVPQDLIVLDEVGFETDDSSTKDASKNEKVEAVNETNTKPTTDSSKNDCFTSFNENLKFQNHKGSILHVKFYESYIIAAGEDGNLYKYDINTGKLVATGKGHWEAITCFIITQTKTNTKNVYSGSLDAHFRIFSFKTLSPGKKYKIDSSIQCMDSDWGYVFIGTISGHMYRYSIEQNCFMDEKRRIGGQTLLALKATREGGRRVLIVAPRNEMVSIRDAISGLLLRYLSFTSVSYTIYSVLLCQSIIYCGTSQKIILAYNFTDGKNLAHMTAGKGVVCLIEYKKLLFAGCYDGNIYVFDLKTRENITTLSGPGSMVLALDVVDNKIIVGCKNSSLEVIKMPEILQKYIIDNR